jgi:formylglycine-generating enzyme
MIRATSAMHLSHVLIRTLLAFLMQGCLLGRDRDDRGEVVGVPGRLGWEMEAPFGMVFVPGGSCVIGAVDPDIAAFVNPPKQVAVGSLYVDKCQVTNNKYRQFINDLLEKAAVGQAEHGRAGGQEDTHASGGVASSSMTKVKSTSGTPSMDSVLSEEFIRKELYPDKRVWQNDFAHHMADRMVECYYEHVAFDDFPVVGITWNAAQHFSKWRTEHLNSYRAQHDLWEMPGFRLPTAAEWTYVAKGGNPSAKYPWGGPYVRDANGKLLANFKASRGNYRECGYDYTSPVDHFAPNDYGLHIGGNVSEWTLDAYNPAASVRMWDLNPGYLDDQEPRKVIKGGSWKDVAYFLQTDAIDYEYKDRARSYIGFRCVMPHIGEEPINNAR